MNFYNVKVEGYIPVYTRTDLTDSLHESFGFRTDYQIVDTKKLIKFQKQQNRKTLRTFLKSKVTQTACFSHL